MKAKQLPNGLDHWLRTRTVVIGGINSPRLPRQQEEPGAVAIRRGLFGLRIKLVPRFKFETRGRAALLGQRVTGCAGSPRAGAG